MTSSVAAASPCSPATALDLPLADLSAQLRPLLAAGTITRTGHARSTRYEA